eukprot:3092211-Pyramimonas_sp.AAC.1
MERAGRALRDATSDGSRFVGPAPIPREVAAVGATSYKVAPLNASMGDSWRGAPLRAKAASSPKEAKGPQVLARLARC